MKDPTEFRQRFDTYKKEGIKAVYDAGKPVPKYDDGTDGKTYLPEYEEREKEFNRWDLKRWGRDIVQLNKDVYNNVADAVNEYGPTALTNGRRLLQFANALTSYKTLARNVMKYGMQVDKGLQGYNPFNEDWFSLPEEDAVYGVPQNAFLLPRIWQAEEFRKAGYIKGKEGDYGLVKKAVGDKNFPIWQTAPDVIERDKLIPLGNINNVWYGPEKAALEQPFFFPSAIYTDGHGKFYQKAWDLNDYGGEHGSTAGFAGRLLDAIGNPTVVTTGFQKVLDKYTNNPMYTFIDHVKPMMRKKSLVPNELDGKLIWTLPEVEVTAPKKHDNGKSIKPLHKYDGGTDDDDFLRHVAYRIMSQSSEPDRALKEIALAVRQELEGDDVDLQYTGSHAWSNDGVFTNKDRDLNKLVLYGNKDKQFKPVSLRGFKYKKFLADNYNLQNTKAYEGHIDNISEVVSPTDYKGLLQFLADRPQYGMYVEPIENPDVEDENEYELWDMTPQKRFNDIDDTASYRRSIRRDVHGNPELASQDIIDYKGNYGLKYGPLAGIYGAMLQSIVPYPIILDQSTPIRFTNDERDYTGVNSIEPTLRAIVDRNKILRPLINQNADYESPVPLNGVVVFGEDPDKARERKEAYEQEELYDQSYDKGKSIHMKQRLQTPQKLYLNYDNELPNVDVVAKKLPEVQVVAPRIKTKAEKELEELKDPFALPSFEDYFNAFMESRGIMTPWSVGKYVNPLKRQVNAIKYGLPMYDEGTNDNDGKYQYKKADTDWHYNWLNARKDILQKNMDTAGISGSADEQIQKQINTLGKVTEIYPPTRNSVADYVGGSTKAVEIDGQRVPYQIEYYDPDPSAGTIAHERTHGLNAVPQETAAKLLDQQLRPSWDAGNEYRNSPTEIYAHLMGIRKLFNMDPQHKVTPEDVRKWREKGGLDTDLNFFSTLDDEGLSKMLNEIAYTGTGNSNLFYADKGKSIHINPANKGKFNATKKRTGKTTEQLAHSKNPLTRKRAVFALNARKWKH